MKQSFAAKVQMTFIIKICFRPGGLSSVWHGTESVSYLDPKLQDFIPTEIKNLNMSMLSNLKLKDGSLKDVKQMSSQASEVYTVDIFVHVYHDVLVIAINTFIHNVPKQSDTL